MIVGSGNRLSAVGASQVAAVGAYPAIETDGFMYWVWQGLAGRMVYSPPVALGGEALSATLTRVQDATNGYPNHVALYGSQATHAVMQCGGNDTIFTNPADIADKITAYEQIVDYLLGIGIMPIVTAILPSDNAPSLALHQRNKTYWNVGLALMCQKKGIPFIDTNPLMVNTTTGALITAYQLDSIHVNEIGAKVMGNEIAAKIMGDGFVIPWTPPLAMSNDANSDDALLLTNPLMMTDTNTDGTPDQWTKSGADSANLTNSLVSGAADGILGNWFKMVKTTTAGDAQNQSDSMTVTAGRWLLLGWVDKYVHVSGAPAVTIRLRTSPANTDLVIKNIRSPNTQSQGLWRHWQAVKIPASQTSVVMRATMDMVGEYYLGQVTIMDLTAVGLDAWL